MGTAVRKHHAFQSQRNLRLIKSYLHLAEDFPLVPITSTAQLDRALEVLGDLLDKGKLNRYEEGYFDVLSKLIHEYESERYPARKMPPVELLKSLIKDHGLKHQDLADQTGVASTTISEIMSGRRKINLRHAKAFSKRFKLQLDAFL